MAEKQALTPDQTLCLGKAIGELGRALTDGTLAGVEMAADGVTGAQRTLDEFLRKLPHRQLPELTNAEVKLSGFLQLYVRKYMSGPLAVILYQMLHRSLAARVWFLFVRHVYNDLTRFKPKQKLTEKELKALCHKRLSRLIECDTNDERMLLATLQLWLDAPKDVNFAAALTEVRTWYEE